MRKMDKFLKILKRVAPLCVAVVLFFAVSAICFAPQFDGRVLPQHDIQQFDGMSRDIRECRAETGEDPQWTGAMFGGMPAYMINIRYPAQIIKRATDWVLGVVDAPIAFLLFAMLSAWLMIVMMGISPWVGLVVGLAYGLSTYFFLIIGAGHVTKMWAAVYAPAMMGAIYMTLRGRHVLLGGALSALFAALEIGANHPQVTYYFLIAVVALWVSDAVFAWREKSVREFAKRTAVLAVAATLAVGANFSSLFYTMQHTSDTTRGGSEVAVDNVANKGLDLEYATAWSYGKAESWNMFIPDFMGGDSANTFSKDGAVADALGELGMAEVATQLPTYWGEQPYTAGPTYLGAVAVFLALLGLLLANNRNRWWIGIATLLAILLSWGHNMMWFTELCFKYLPMYNKFRTVSMSLMLVEWSVPLLAGIALWQLWCCQDKRRVLRATAVAAGVSAVVAVTFILFGSSLFDFGREADGEMMSEQFYYMLKQSGADDYIAKGLHDELGFEVADAMARERASILRADALRSLLFVVLAAACVAVCALGRLKRGYMVAIIALLVTVDLGGVAFRYLSHDDFVSPRKVQMRPSEADKAIMEDASLGYRVLNLSVSPFNDATTSMFHRSVGGYHGAKLGRYQDVIDRYLLSLNEGVLDMLNTRYVITRDGEPAVRSSAFGPAWLVQELVTASTAEQELSALGELNLAESAVVSEQETLPTTEFSTNGVIYLTEYQPNYLKYDYAASAPTFAVFSEIFYDKGWKAYIDGKEASAMRVDYILRGMALPEGQHTIEWRFRAPYWGAVEAATLVCSILIILMLILALIYTVKDEKQQSLEA